MNDRQNRKQSEDRQLNGLARGTVIFLPLCTALGVLFGIATHSMALGLILGVSTGTALGVAVGSALMEREKD